jgi:triacylglycerol lipase
MAGETSTALRFFIFTTILALATASQGPSDTTKHGIKSVTTDQLLKIITDDASVTKTKAVGIRRQNLRRLAQDYEAATTDYGDYSSPAADFGEYAPAGDYSPPAPDYGTGEEEYYAPAAGEYAPAAGEYAPAVDEYAPAVDEYAPAVDEYAPADDSGGVTAVPVSAETVDGCPSAQGTSCLAYTAADEPQLYEVMTMVAADLATKAYMTSEEGITYVKETLGAADAQFISNSATGTQVLIAIDNDAIIASFRGTEMSESADIDTNVLVELVSTSFGSAGSGKVHQGFLQAVESIYSELSSLLREKNPGSTRKLYFTGHSLGSALATLAAAKVQADSALGQSVSGVYSLAGPRVGDASWAEVYSRLGLASKTLRVVYFKDAIPLIPPVSMGYEHVGRSAILPLDASTCSETGEDEYNVCEVDGSIYNFLDVLGSQFSCATVGNLLVGGFCAVTDNSYAAAMCPYMAADTLMGNICCAALEAFQSPESFLVSDIIIHISPINKPLSFP